METTTRQTIIRMDERLYQRLRMSASKQHRSVNSLMVSILEANTPEELPKLDPADFAPSERIRRLGRALAGVSLDRDTLDEKSKYILAK